MEKILVLALCVLAAGCGSSSTAIEVSAPATPRGRALAMLTREVLVALSNEEGSSIEVSRRPVSHLGAGLAIEAELPEDAPEGDSVTWHVTALDENGAPLLSGIGRPSEEDEIVRIPLKEESL